jgi:hypothetical protein
MAGHLWAWYLQLLLDLSVDEAIEGMELEEEEKVY